jgi:hypothetical protein
MRRLVIAVLALAIGLFVLGGAVALAEPAPKPEVVEETDLLKVQLAESQAREAALRANALMVAFRAKYHLGDSDQVDEKGRIVRAPKPEKKPAK